MSGIFCIENDNYYPTLTPIDGRVLNCENLLRLVSQLTGAKHIRFGCPTIESLKYRINHTRKQGYNILYLASHGEIGTWKTEKEVIPLLNLADMMGDRFRGWCIHFGSCLTLGDVECAKEFKSKTGARLVSGYNQYVAFDDSVAMANEFIWLMVLSQGHRKMPVETKKIAQTNGFVVV